MSRIFEAMERAHLLGEDGRPKVPLGRQLGKLTPERSQDPYSQLSNSLSWAIAPKRRGAILVTSAIHGEGASTVARNLAAKLATSQLRTLLIDGNLRRPTQHSALRSTRMAGLTDVASSNLPIQKALGTSPETGLTFLPSGRPTNAPVQVLDSLRLDRAIERLRESFERIIVDGPPVTVYPDAAILGRLVDGAVIVVRAESTKREVVDQAKAELDRAGIRVLGAVLNCHRFHIPAWIYDRL